MTTNPASDLQPVFSPDGRTLFVRVAAASRFRVRSLVPRRVRPLDRRKAHVVHDARSLGRRLFAVARRVRSGSRPAGRRATNLFVVPPQAACRRPSCTGGAISAARPGPGFVVFSKSTLTAPAGYLPRRRRTAGTSGRSRARTRRGSRTSGSPSPRASPRQRRRREDSVLADQAAGLRPGEKVSGRLSDPRRTPGRVGGRAGRRAGTRRSGRRRAGSSPRRTRAAPPGSGRRSSTRSAATGAGR